MKITRALGHAKRRVAALTAAVAAAGLLATARMAGSAHASAGTTTTSGPKPSIVLIHGAWADSSSWDARRQPTAARRVYGLRAAQPPARHQL